MELLDFTVLKDFFISFPNYEIKGILGTGSFSTVIRVYDKIQHEEIAVKIVDKSLFSNCKNFLKAECKILATLSNKFMVKFIQSKESTRFLYIVMEIILGISLEHYVTKTQDVISEKNMQIIMKQLLQAVVYLHSKDIIHRDLKPENIIIDPLTLGIKIIDFGLSYASQSFKRSRDSCGTLLYQAPEMARGQEYCKSVDLYSCGIIMYFIFSRGRHPIWDRVNDTRKMFIEKLCGNQEWKIPNNMNPAALSFFLKTAAKIHSCRMSAGQALNHPWITGSGDLSEPLTMQDTVETFERQQNLNKSMYKLSQRSKQPIIRKSISQRGLIYLQPLCDISKQQDVTFSDSRMCSPKAQYRQQERTKTLQNLFQTSPRTTITTKDFKTQPRLTEKYVIPTPTHKKAPQRTRLPQIQKTIPHLHEPINIRESLNKSYQLCQQLFAIQLAHKNPIHCKKF